MLSSSSTSEAFEDEVSKSSFKGISVGFTLRLYGIIIWEEGRNKALGKSALDWSSLVWALRRVGMLSALADLSMGKGCVTGWKGKAIFEFVT